MKAKIKVWEGSTTMLGSNRFIISKQYYWSVRVPRRYRVDWISTSGRKTTFEEALGSARLCVEKLKAAYEDKTPKKYTEKVLL